MKRRTFISGCALIAATVGFSLPAMAGPIATETFTLTNDGCTGGCGTNGQGSSNNNFGQIVLSDPGTGTVSVTETLNGTKFVNSSGKEALGFNLLGTLTGVVINITSPSTGFSVASGAQSMPPYGSFSDAIHCDACGSGGSHPQSGPLTFTVTATGGVTLADFITNGPGGTGFSFASDVLGNGNTGDVAATGTFTTGNTPVPEPLTLSLFGAGLAGAVALRRRKRA